MKRFITFQWWSSLKEATHVFALSFSHVKQRQERREEDWKG